MYTTGMLPTKEGNNADWTNFGKNYSNKRDYVMSTQKR